MYVFLVLVGLVVTCGSEHVLESIERECREASGGSLDPCQRMCELRKFGMTRDGRFDVNNVMRTIEEMEDPRLEPESNRILLKAAFMSCSRDASREKGTDVCTVATKVYQCARDLLVIPSTDPKD